MADSKKYESHHVEQNNLSWHIVSVENYIFFLWKNNVGPDHIDQLKYDPDYNKLILSWFVDYEQVVTWNKIRYVYWQHHTVKCYVSHMNHYFCFN
jgi:hypothetical protein